MPFISLPQKGSEKQERKMCLFLPEEDCRENPEMALSVERTFGLWGAARDKEWISLSLSAVKSWTSWDQKLIHGGTWCISSSCEMTSWRKGHGGTWQVTWEVTEMGKKKQKEELKKGKDTKRGKEKCSLQKHFRWLSLSQGWACKSCRKVLQMWDGGHSWLGEHSWEVPASAFQVRNPSKDNPPGAPSSCSCLWGEQAAASSGREAESHTHHLLSSNILRISTRITTPSSWVTHTAGRKGWQKWPQGCLGDTLGHLGTGGAG